jgi:hypothetical protein
MTHIPEEAAVRTEADVRAALADLAGRAPGTAAVLTGMRTAGSRRGARRPASRVRRPHLVAGAAGAAAATALAVVLTPGSAPAPVLGGPRMAGLLPSPAAEARTSPLGSGGPGRDSSTASVAKAMLAAFDATANDLEYETESGWTKGRYVDRYQTWSWPALTSPGHLEYARELFSQLPVGKAKGTAGVEPTEDDQYVTVVPHPSRYGQNTWAHLVIVCFAGTGQTGCGWGHYNTPAGTWSAHTGKLAYEDFSPQPRGADLARQIARGDWRIVGQERLRGQQAIKLSQTRKGEFDGHPVYLWVSAATFLPLRMYAAGGGGLAIDNWYYLPPTKANLAMLRVPIPPGYPRSG